MTDEELARVLRDRRDLVPKATAALDHEIQKRQLDPSQLRKLRPHFERNPHHPTQVEKRLKGKRISWFWLFADMVMAFLLASLLDHFGVEELFWPIVITAAVPAFTIWGHLELVRRGWFWIAITLIVMAHILFFRFVAWPWGTKWVPAVTIKGIVTLDLIGVFALISRIERLLGEDQPAPLRPSTSG